jgi:hypothetical protein
MLGLFPLEGTEKLNAVLPLFSTVTVCGLSLLVEPVECPAFFVPVPMRETGRKGAEDGEGQEAYT